MTVARKLYRKLAPLYLVLIAGLILACSDLANSPSESDVRSTASADSGSKISLVTVAATGVGCTNEPTGFTAFSNQPFNASPPPAPNVDAYGWKNYTVVASRVAPVTDYNPGGSPSTVVRGKFPQGL